MSFSCRAADPPEALTKLEDANAMQPPPTPAEQEHKSTAAAAADAIAEAKMEDDAKSPSRAELQCRESLQMDEVRWHVTCPCRQC